MYDIELGDKITFKAITRWSNKQAIRIVNGFDYFGRPTVRYSGCGDFVVRLREISQVDACRDRSLYTRPNLTKG